MKGLILMILTALTVVAGFSPVSFVPGLTRANSRGLKMEYSTFLLALFAELSYCELIQPVVLPLNQFPMV